MGHISVTDPINPAIEQVKKLLFRPFDLGKWFTIGFCAWLAYLGEQGAGGSFNNGNSDRHQGDVRQQYEHGREVVLQNLYWIVPVVVVVILVVLALWVLMLWLNSRGKFMFLNCVALDRAEVREPWNRFSDVANSLFVFRIVLGLIGMVITLPLIVLMILFGISMFIHETWNFGGIMVMVAMGMGMVIISICFLLIRKLTTDFVVPIMFLRGSRCLDAWREFWQLLRSNFGEFVLYLLFQIVIAIAVGLIVLIVIIATCCIAGCVMAIPYIGTVLLLPVLVFTRAYSLYYLAQYGPAYNVFPPVMPPSY